MPGSRNETHARGTPRSRSDGRAASGARVAVPKEAGDGAPGGAPRPEGTANGARRERGAERGASENREEAVLRDLLRGLRAGDLEALLLTVQMAAEENRMPSADPDEARRILAFLARLAEHDALLPPPPDGAGVGPGGPPPDAG